MSTESAEMAWWREPTRGQWFTFVAAWVGLGARRVRLHDLPSRDAAHGARVSRRRDGDGRLDHADAAVAPVRRRGGGRGRRSLGAQAAAHDLARLVRRVRRRRRVRAVVQAGCWSCARCSASAWAPSGPRARRWRWRTGRRAAAASPRACCREAGRSATSWRRWRSAWVVPHFGWRALFLVRGGAGAAGPAHPHLGAGERGVEGAQARRGAHDVARSRMCDCTITRARAHHRLGLGGRWAAASAPTTG